jgi:hypothetical protein
MDGCGSVLLYSWAVYCVDTIRYGFDVPTKSWARAWNAGPCAATAVAAAAATAAVDAAAAISAAATAAVDAAAGFCCPGAARDGECYTGAACDGHRGHPDGNDSSTAAAGTMISAQNGKVHRSCRGGTLVDLWHAVLCRGPVPTVVQGLSTCVFTVQL